MHVQQPVNNQRCSADIRFTNPVLLIRMLSMSTGYHSSWWRRKGASMFPENGKRCDGQSRNMGRVMPRDGNLYLKLDFWSVY